MQVPLLQKRPSQQRCPLAPHASHVYAQQTAPSPQVPSGEFSSQQRWPMPPHATHCPPYSVAKGPVQSMLLQRVWPMDPQLPSAQLPPLQVPLLELEPHCAPGPTQVPDTQQPPPPQTFPVQQAWPGWPQGAHCPLRLQVRPGAVQKSRWYVSSLSQHAWPGPPQVPQLKVPAVHTPSGCPLPTWPPQPASTSTQVLPAQQPAAQVLSPQHGWPAPPHATKVPWRHTVLGALPFFPLCTQRPVVVSWHVPPRHGTAVMQAGWPGPPHPRHTLSTQDS